MNTELREILNNTGYPGDNIKYTHVSMYGPKANWAILNENRGEFWEKYCNLTKEEEEENICLAERQKEIIPLIGIFKFKFQYDEEEEENDTWEPYDEVFLMNICKIYQNVINEVCQINNETGQELIALILESESHWYELIDNVRYMSMDIKIQFPYTKLDLDKQNNIIRPRILKMLRQKNILSKLSRQPIGDWENILYKIKKEEPIVMYGSNDIENKEKLKLTYIWNWIEENYLEDDNFEEDYDIDLPLENIFLLHNHPHIKQSTNPYFKNNNIILEDILPILLSIEYWETPTLLKLDQQVKERTLIQNINIDNRIFGRKERKVNKDILTIAQDFLNILNKDRFKIEPIWLDIGKALYYCDNGGKNGLFTWIRNTKNIFNSLNENYPAFMLINESLEETCKNYYNYKFSESKITIKTLGWYARYDNFDRYKEWHSNYIFEYLEEALSLEHSDVGIAFFKFYWLDFTYCPIGKGRWYKFTKTRWIEAHQSLDLRKILSDNFLKVFEHKRVILSRQIHDSDDEAIRASGEVTINKISKLISKLKTVSYKNSIICELCEHFSNSDFYSNLNSNPDILGVKNGVIEIINNNAFFRPTKPEDYVSLSAGVNYDESLNWDSPSVVKCNTWLQQIFTDKSLCHHFKKFASSILRAKNNDKIFPILTGDGDNSKSMLVKMFELVFGEYCIKLDVSNVTVRNNNPSGPTPQLARARATRVVFMDEPSDDVPLHKDTIKRWSGGDSFYARQLHDDGGDVDVFFKLILTCNKIPVITNPDKAMKNRTRVFPFMSTWVDDAPDSIEEQYLQRKFPKDRFFENRIPSMAPAFLWILVQYYPSYASEGLDDPDIVIKTTQQYWNDNDIFAQFTNENITKAIDYNGNQDLTVRITLSEIYSEFKSWFRESFPSSKVPERAIVRNELSSRWGRLSGGSWYGIRLIESDFSNDATSALLFNSKPSSSPLILGPSANISKSSPSYIKNTFIPPIPSSPIII